MSGADSFHRDSQEPIGLSLNLSSNNPFRNRAASPASPFDDPPARPLSRNPFLEQPPPPLKSPGAMSNNSEGAKSLSAEEIFVGSARPSSSANSLTLDEKKPMDLKDPTIGATGPRRENVPPLDATNNRPAGSEEEALRARKMPPPGARAGPSASPNRRPPPRPRPRRNSDSSVLDFDSMPLTEEEKQIIARRRERERQKREARPEGQAKELRERREPREPREPLEPRERREGRENREGKSSRSKSGRPNRRVDIIDQLDATGIYGTGLFHHDGPFDALNPHRNRNKARRAPMQAFPKDSLNNSLGGAGPLNMKGDHSAFMGQGNEEAFREFSYRAKTTHEPEDTRGAGSNPRIIDPIARGDVIHGEESVGLGTSTFLEGTPAARTAIVRTREEQAREQAEGGLQRKKSLAQRIRHINKGPRDYGPGRVTSPDRVASAGQTEGNPFFTEYGKGEEAFTVRARDGAMSPNSPPRRGSSGAALERRATADGAFGSEDGGKPSGFLGRMKSLKGGRRQRRDDSSPTSPPGNPGTAI